MITGGFNFNSIFIFTAEFTATNIIKDIKTKDIKTKDIKTNQIALICVKNSKANLLKILLEKIEFSGKMEISDKKRN